MGETCSTCGLAVAGASILYAPDGRIVCPSCFSQLPPPADLGRAPWRTFAIAAGVAGVIPFAIHVSSSSSTTVNGQVTSFVYRDWIAVACGVVAILLGVVALAAARKEQLQRALAFAAGVGVVLLGGAQIARGFGLFAKPGGADSSTSISITHGPDLPSTPTELPAPKGDPNDPDTCPAPQTCFDLGRTLEKTDPANATKAWERACDLGAMGGCFNAGLMWIEKEPPEVEKAAPWFAKACDHGDASACEHLGRVLATDGPTKDLAKAKAMFEKGCDGNDANGCLRLGMLYDQGLGMDQDETKARELFDKACAGGAGDACDYLGEMRRQGIGGPKDARGALAAYTDGCKLANDGACKALESPKPSPKPKKRK